MLLITPASASLMINRPGNPAIMLPANRQVANQRTGRSEPMRALVLEEWWRLTVADVPDPVVGEHDVLLEILATGICGSDIHGYTGDNGRREPGQVMGHETVGRVIARGAGLADGDGAPVG